MNITLIAIVAIFVVITILFIKFKTKKDPTTVTAHDERKKMKEVKASIKKEEVLTKKHQEATAQAEYVRTSTKTSHDSRKKNMSDLIKKRNKT